MQNGNIRNWFCVLEGVNIGLTLLLHSELKIGGLSFTQKSWNICFNRKCLSPTFSTGEVDQGAFGIQQPSWELSDLYKITLNSCKPGKMRFVSLLHFWRLLWEGGEIQNRCFCQIFYSYRNAIWEEPANCRRIFWTISWVVNKIEPLKEIAEPIHFLRQNTKKTNLWNYLHFVAEDISEIIFEPLW